MGNKYAIFVRPSFAGHLLDAELLCPKNSLLFDLEACDPNRRSQCPSGFTCSNDTENQNHTIYLCCETSSMTIEDCEFCGLQR
uniref:Chitin-binding type-2 domain-containing protein n=1 Tax=Angiostrongylus cantonensis TaxID=6313 RepID=A0A0K0DNT3_ANGCA